MTPNQEPQTTQPFSHDTEYLEAEFGWIKARCLYLGARINAEHEIRDQHLGLVAADDPQAGWPDETKQKIARLAVAETTLRETIDARLEATQAAGRLLGLDRLVRQHDLADMERQVLLLTTMPALGLELYEVLGSVGSFGFSIMAITPALVATFAGLDLIATLGLRRQLGPKGKLVAGGLVEVDLPGGERCQDFPLASIFIEQVAFEQVAGIASDDAAGTCPSCDQAAQPPSRR